MLQYMQPLSSIVNNGKELYNTNSPSASLVAIIRIIHTCVHVLRIVPAPAIRGRCLAKKIWYPIDVLLWHL